MAKIEGTSDGSINAQIGDGPNFIAAGVNRDTRVKLSAGVGAVGEKLTAHGKLIGSLSAQATASAKLNGEYTPPAPQAVYPTNSADLHQIHAFGKEIMDLTGGTGDMNKITIEDADRLRKKYPIIFKESQHKSSDEFLSSVDAAVNFYNDSIASGSAQLLPGNSYPQELQKYGLSASLINALLPAGTLKTSDITGQTIGSVRADVNQVYSDWHNKYGGAVKITDTIASGGSTGNKQLDDLIKIYVPNHNLSEVQKQELLAEMLKAEAEIDKNKDHLDHVPSPSKVTSQYNDVEKILKWDPTLAASISATGAYAHNNGVVFAADLTKGLKADVNSVIAERATPNSSIDYHVYPTNFTRSTVSVGKGSNVFSALPPELSNKLGVVPTGDNGVGGYVAASQERDKMQGIGSTEQKLAAGFNASKKLSADSFGYVNVEAACTKAPALTPKTDCKVTAQTGVKF